MTAAIETPCTPGVAWFVLHTRSRQEKALADELLTRHIDHFLPCVVRTRYWGKRKALVDEPLFPGYVFLRGTTEQAYVADRTRRVARIIPVADQQQLAWELRNLALALDNRVPLDPYPYLKTGMRVEVISGPFRGLQGLIESRTGGRKLILAVDMLGQAVSVELEGAAVEPVG